MNFEAMDRRLRADVKPVPNVAGSARSIGKSEVRVTCEASSKIPLYVQHVTTLFAL